ncbi:protein DpdD [Bosea sp. NBC_00550]|uniref:protein DpdD n=1 Tax=Bosea sp. NBC_00550 TaxID=2969621 RepID=UPI0022316163|nr:protein DpdD [Bosea sp. NBC_00550]UZF90652.1 protein DpdD [Bosea sp. NBC_00550]
MIGTSPDAAREVLADLIALQPWVGASPDFAALCADVTQSVVDEAFPGALVPVVNSDGSMQIDVAAPTMSNWRRLKPVLLAFAGPTVTGFDGVPVPFDAADPVGARLMLVAPGVTAIMPLPMDERSRIGALRAVLRARDTLARAPELQRSAPVSTSWLLGRFQDYLNVGRRDAATGVLERLRSELRLDALNLKFLKVQLLAVFEDWTGIVALPEFPSLSVARRTPAITAILLEALYQTHIAGSFDAGNIADTRTAFEASVQSLVQSMLINGAPLGLGAGGWRLLGLEALSDPGRQDLLAMLVDRGEELGWIADLLPAPAPSGPRAVDVAAPIDTARDALIQAEAVDSIDLLADAMAAMARLSPDELALLRETMPFRPIVHVTDEFANIAPPTSWIAWLDRAADPTFADALDIARRGKDEWEIGASTGDPAAVRALVAALEKAQGDDLAADRTTQALPYLVAWLQRDAEFPRAALSPVYGRLLTLFALGTARGATIYESSQVLVEALLASGVDQKSYRDLIADIDEISGDGFGVDMIYWVLELVESFMNAAAPDASARETFLHRILARIVPIYARLTGLQRVTVNLLSSELGWSLPITMATDAVSTNDGLAGRLAGLRIAIYSLTESSSRQAKGALEEITKAVLVDTNADHGGSARLRALAENSDLFVMTWLSAKHAATDFIRSHRGDKPLIYSRGRGFSSTLRAIEEFLMSRGKTTA